jgi:hypothetical protein
MQRFRVATAPWLADLSAVRAAAGAAGGPLATDLPAGEPLASSMFSVSSVLNDSSSILGDDRPRFSSK